MYRYVKLTAGIYGAWCLLWVMVAAIWSGEHSISAHLWLSLSGMPLSLLSLGLPNASLIAIWVAAGLGLLQWLLVAWLASRWDAHND